MGSSIRKIGILILVIIILPVLFFSIFEIGNFRRNEKDIQDIYRNQLDAILFSVNQYSNDILTNLAIVIETRSNLYPADSHSIRQLIHEKTAVECLLQFDQDLKFLSGEPDSYADSLDMVMVTKQIRNTDSTLQRLQTYFRAGYRKILSIDQGVTKEQWIVFLSQSGDKTLINVLIINPEKFIGQVLDPKIQEIARGKFHIVAFRPGEKVPFYSSDKQYNPVKIDDKKPFWLLKDYTMGIELKDLTIADLARKRSRNSLILIIIMDIILLSGAWMIFRNIRKQIELSQLKSDFVSNVSHEIRTPLALISMYIETLEMGRVKSKEKIHEYYTVIYNETSRLSAMVNRILNFSQIENNKRKYFFTEININDIAEKIAATFRYTMENKGFSFSFEPDKELPLLVADHEAIADAIVNLIDNAMKYSRDRKEIVMRTGKNGNSVFIEVEDHGIGIAEKNQKFIFDKFYRVTEKNLANKVKGSGLGLAIVKHIMDAHQGEISVQSSQQEGSVFRLLFPLK
jgi:two-component system phosphate regulon sensor histidine kinase PhoR